MLFRVIFVDNYYLAIIHKLHYNYYVIILRNQPLTVKITNPTSSVKVHHRHEERNSRIRQIEKGKLVSEDPYSNGYVI